MPRSDDLYTLPPDLPVPVDDGACDHLLGLFVPPVALRSTSGRSVRLDLVCADQRTVLFCYPRTGTPDRDPPRGWNQIPGARGCTPQCRAFGQLYGWFKEHQIVLFGMSTQSTEYQREMVKRLNLPFEVLSDESLELTSHLRLPTFEVDSMTLLKRATLVLFAGRIEKVFYPIYPPDRNAEVVAEWLAAGEPSAGTPHL